MTPKSGAHLLPRAKDPWDRRRLKPSDLAGRISPPTHPASGEPLRPFAGFVSEASRRFTEPEHWICAVTRVESGEKSRARSRKGAHSSDADHAKDLGRIARALRSW